MNYFFSMLLLLLSFAAQAQSTFNAQKLNDFFSLLEKNNKFMGSVAIYKNGTPVFEKSMGFANQEKNVTATKNTTYRIGSITKTFTSAIILQLVQENKLSLETKLKTYFPNIKNADKISIKQLLNHSSGIKNYTADSLFESYVLMPQSQKQLVARIEKASSDFEPGEKHEYSNSNFLLLGYILEKIEKKPFKEILAQRISKPLKLKSINFETTSTNDTKSYVFQENSWQSVPHWALSVAGAAGAIQSNTSDLCAYFTALFQGNVINESSLKQMTTMEDHFGLGIFRAPFYNRMAYSHSGGIEGFRSSLFYFDTDSVAFVILSNGLNYDNNDVAIAMMSAYFNRDYELPDFTAKKSIALSNEVLKSYEGNYVNSNFPLQIKLFTTDEGLNAQATGQGAFLLTPISETLFEYKAAGIQIEMEVTDDTKNLILNQAGNKIKFELEK